MDQNFSDILNIFKRLDEGATKELMWKDAERMTREQFCEKWGNEHGEFWDAICGELDEGTMADAEHHERGPKFTGYWKGKDKATPGNKMVGSCEESIELEEDGELEAELREAFGAYLKEYGAIGATGAAGAPNTAGGVANNQAATAKELNTAQQNLNKLKTAGVQLPTGVSQAAQTAVKDPSLPQTTQDKKTSMALGQTVQQLVDKGSPSDVSQVANAIKKISQAGN